MVLIKINTDTLETWCMIINTQFILYKYLVDMNHVETVLSACISVYSKYYPGVVFVKQYGREQSCFSGVFLILKSSY